KKKMGSLRSLVTSLPKFGHAGATIARTRNWNPRLFAAATPRPIQVPTSHEQGSVSSDGIKQGASETVNVPGDQNLQDKAYSTTPQNVTHKAKEVGAEMSAKAENMGEKAKQAMQDAWDSTKNTAQRAADSVLGKAQDSADALKDNAESLKRSINNDNNNKN
ncbi:hypothetical protein MLE29_10735, partial [Pasteurella multocida]